MAESNIRHYKVPTKIPHVVLKLTTEEARELVLLLQNAQATTPKGVRLRYEIIGVVNETLDAI